VSNPSKITEFGDRFTQVCEGLNHAQSFTSHTAPKLDRADAALGLYGTLLATAGVAAGVPGTLLLGPAGIGLRPQAARRSWSVPCFPLATQCFLP